MKTLTCAQFGGPCDFAATTATEKEMSDAMWRHTKKAHPDEFAMAKDMMKNATPEQKNQTTAYFHKIWEEAPEDLT
jgi:predicted small metal-binding protein